MRPLAAIVRPKSIAFLGLSVFSISIAFANICDAATKYYFAAIGNDNNNCASSDLPCRSVRRANSLAYVPGDSIRFRGGDEFFGCLELNLRNVADGGSVANPITVGSYGAGRATLLSTCPGRHALITIDSISGVTVQGLALFANGTTTAMGVLIQNSNGNKVVDGVIIEDNDIGGFNISGPGLSSEVFVSGFATNGKCGALNHIQILGNKLHGMEGPTSPDDNGITGYGCGHNITDVKYSRNEVYNIGGDNGSPGGTSGNGILAAEVDGGEISFNSVHDNGANTVTCGGPAGVWAFRSTNIAIRYNEVYRMRPLPNYPVGGCDWAAYDLDVGVTNSVVEYNYSHNNAGAGLLEYAKEIWGKNTFRFNISENDEALMAGNSGSIALSSGGVSYVYNNTIYRDGHYMGTTAPSCVSFGFEGVFPKGTVVGNNLCINSMTDRFERTRYLDSGTPDVSAVAVMNNLYCDPRGVAGWNWGGADYSSLVSFQSATGKDHNSIVGCPAITDLGAGGTCVWTPRLTNGPQPCPSVYKLKGGSIAIGTGADLRGAPYGLDIGRSDYYGDVIPNHRAGSGFNIGADGSAQ
jgi:hypothetical protein